MQIRTQVKRVAGAIRAMWTYLRALPIAKLHYDYCFLANSKYAKGGKYGRFTAPIWTWILNDYKACKKMKVNLNVPWPVSARVHVVCPENIMFHPDDLNNFQGFGNYFQAIGRITIGHGTYIAPNVGIITANHDVDNLDEHTQAKAVTIGEKCWIGMNSVILPGVILGEKTVVGAGSVVTKSFPSGHCIVGGNPAKIIRVLDHEAQMCTEDKYRT